MGRVGFELSVAAPQVILQTDEDGNTVEPAEEVMIEVPQHLSGQHIYILFICHLYLLW